MTTPRYIGGVDWAGTSPYQEIIGLSKDDAKSLKAVDRLDRLGATGARPLLLEGTPRRAGEARLLLTGGREAVERSRGVLTQMLCKEQGLTVPVHPLDTRNLQKPSRGLIADLERETGCRVIVDRSQSVADTVVDRKQHLVHLLGDEAAQASARKLLTPHCERLAPPNDNTRWLQGFDPEVKGSCVELPAQAVARRVGNVEEAPKGCVVAGNGQCRIYLPGSFFCLALQKWDSNPKLRGAMRLGVTCRRPSSGTPPDTLLVRPKMSWVLGGGRARGPRRVLALKAANFEEQLMEGDELGLLVTKEGSLAVFRRPGGSWNWECMVHWNAGVADPTQCFPLFELAGRAVEVKLLLHGPPSEVGRAHDDAQETPPIWPPPTRPEDTVGYSARVST